MRLRGLLLIALTGFAVVAVSRPAAERIPTAEDSIEPLASLELQLLGGAPTPEISTSWFDIVIAASQQALKDRLFSVAASVAFYAFLAIVPALSVAVSLFGLFGAPERIAEMPSGLTSFLPSEAVGLVQEQARRLAESSSRDLSLRLVVGALISLWGVSSAVRATFDALNLIEGQEEERSTLKLYSTALLATVAGVLVFAVAIVIIGLNPSFLAFGALSADAVRLFALARWPVFFAIAVVTLAGLYWIGPSRRPSHFTRLLPGAAFAALAWTAFSAAFAWYVTLLGNYSATYGSLAAVVVMMTWLWLSTATVLFGAQLNAERERRLELVDRAALKRVRSAL